MPPWILLALVSLAGLFVAPAAYAHHGFSGEYDASRPFYIAGRVVEARLGQPHTRLRLEVPADLQVPTGSASLARHDPSHGPDLLERLRPWPRAERVEILLEPFMTRETVALRRPAVGDSIEAIAHPRVSDDGRRGELRVILLVLDDGERVLTAPRRSYHRHPSR
jgi:hypothetical protein